jgi:hypothetical protein
MRHHFMLDGQINPREWYNFHPREFLPYYYDNYKFVYEQSQWAHMRQLLCRPVHTKDVLQLCKYPEPNTFIIDCRMDPAKMHRWVPTSNWIPRDEVEYAITLSDEEFSELYGFRKPQHDDDIILLSHNGMASEQAGWEFRKRFYLHVYNARGGTNELFGESYLDYPPHVDPKTGKLAPWKGPFPQSAIYTDEYSHRKVLTRAGPFDVQYELQDFALPDLELEKPRHSEEHGPRGHMPYGLQ